MVTVMFGARWVIVSGLLLGVPGCVERAEGLAFAAAAPPIAVTSTTRELGDGQREWQVTVRANSEWFERAAAHMTLDVDGRHVPLRRAGAGLEGRWRGARHERATLSWRASDGSAGLFVELAPSPPETASPRFSPVPRTGIVRAAVPLEGAP